MKKNILMFVTDEHRLSGIGAYGNTPCKTPNIDKLAENGVLFENNYTSHVRSARLQGHRLLPDSIFIPTA